LVAVAGTATTIVIGGNDAPPDIESDLTQSTVLVPEQLTGTAGGRCSESGGQRLGHGRCA